MRRTTIAALLAVLMLTAQTAVAREKVVVWEQPATEVNTEIEGYFDTLLEITRVEFTKDETRVMMHVANRESNWVKFASTTHLVADGKTYALTSLDGMALEKETHLRNHGQVDLVFHFQPLPMKTKRFDFTEGDFNGAFKLLGIEAANTRAGQLFPSNWRNTQTGEWDISFYDECAIYDCQFWNYKQRQEKGDAYTFVLENGGKEITVNVAKNKNGLREITIDGKTGIYNLISSITLPDYPQKDTRTDFKDTHYQTDTVTFIGWMKDMPQQMKDKDNEYSVSVYDDIFDSRSNANTSYAKMDSLGRFVMKIPVLNSAEAFFDWNRTYIRTLFEPGETYLMLYDFKGGHKLFMGKNCRLQNETLAHRVGWVGANSEGNMDEKAAMKYLEATRADKEDELKVMKQVIAAHPTISDRYIKYLTNVYNVTEGECLMQGRFYMKDRIVPPRYLNYVHRQHWQHPTLPYTLCREFKTLKRDYIDQLVYDRYCIPSRDKRYYITPSENMYVPVLRRAKEAGKVKMTDEELALIERYANDHTKYDYWLVREDDEEAKKASDAYFQQEFVKQSLAILGREDIRQELENESRLFEVYRALDRLDSVGSDQDLRDIIITSILHQEVDHNREPLSDYVMHFFDENVKMPAAKDFLHAQQEKYLALHRKNISHAESLKSAEDVANMSDGEKILRKLIEPYKGKIILLDIWGTWCGPCKAALAESQEEYERLKEFDLVYLYLCNGSSDESWKNVIKEYDVTGENVAHYNLPQAQQSAIEHFLNVRAFPTYKLIDRDGTILEVNADPRDLEGDGLIKILKQMK